MPAHKKDSIAKSQSEPDVQAVLPGQGRSLDARGGQLLKQHREMVGSTAVPVLASAPGRVELVGNHTDHNHGLVLAAAVNLDTLVAASPRDDTLIRLSSEGYGVVTLDISQLDPRKEEAGTTAALLRGVAAGMAQAGFRVGGFDGVMTSRVMSGSGLSSSAAFEVLACYLFDILFNGETMRPDLRARIGQFAENNYFMKPSGLMDQMASSFGGMVMIDFQDPEPRVERLSYSFASAGYAMVVVDTGSSHGDLTDAYSAIPREMRAAAKAAGGETLRDVPPERFLASLGAVRQAVGDRAVLRALHFYQENSRVAQAASALRQNDADAFFDAVKRSGLSSWTLLQNVHTGDREQPLALALAVAGQVLDGRGACRVHGGGFAGTTLNFVPLELLDRFTGVMEGLFGPACCHTLDVREQGPVRLN